MINKAVWIALTMLLHECGHLVACWSFGVKVKRIGFCWTGAYIQRERSAGWGEVTVCLAGPAVNLALAIALWRWDSWAALLNLIYFVVNLLPIANSDGTHAWEALEAKFQ